jgi:anaerobic C4-dicarboxylate transporter
MDKKSPNTFYYILIILLLIFTIINAGLYKFLSDNDKIYNKNLKEGKLESQSNKDNTKRTEKNINYGSANLIFLIINIIFIIIMGIFIYRKKIYNKQKLSALDEEQDPLPYIDQRYVDENESSD